MNKNVSAFLHVIRACEGTAGPDGYRTMFGGALFDSYADHPRKRIPYKDTFTTAAGAYQFLASTWDDCRAKLGLPDFSPESQDRAAVFLIQRRGALEDVTEGRLDEAIAKTNKEWASLPGSPYGQPTRTLAYCHEVYARHGGRINPRQANLSTAPEPVQVPKEGTTVPSSGINRSSRMGPLAFLPAILDMAPKLAALFGKQDVAEKVAAAATIVDTFTKAVPGAVNAQDAIEKAQADPVVQKAAVAAVESPAVLTLVEVGGGFAAARDEYAAINRDLEDDVWWRIPAKFVFNPVHWVTGVFLWWVQQFIPALVESVRKLDTAAAMGLIVIVFGVVAIVSGRWMGAYQQGRRNE